MFLVSVEFGDQKICDKTLAKNTIQFGVDPKFSSMRIRRIYYYAQGCTSYLVMTHISKIDLPEHGRLFITTVLLLGF